MVLYFWKYGGGSFYRVHVMDNATSVIWIRRYYDAGEFELYIRATAEMLQLFSSDDIFITREDSPTVMISENVQLHTDAENGDYITVTGKSAENILSRRIVPKQTTYQNTGYETVIRSLITNNMISPSVSARQIPFVILGNVQGYTTVINKQVTGKTLLETISAICQDQNTGFRMTFDGVRFTFELYRGVDRSYNQNVNDFVVFSPNFENIGDTDYSNDRSTLYNVVYVAGEGEGKDRFITNVGTASGYARRELWMDARNESSNTDEGPLTPTMYGRMLSQQGLEMLKTTTETVNFEGELLNTNEYVFGVDYDLGDIVQIENEYGIRGRATVIEVREVEDETGLRIYPVFAEWSVN